MINKTIFPFMLAILLSAATNIVSAESAIAKSAVDHAKNKIMMVYKNPKCGCCDKWVKHINDFGLLSQVVSGSNVATIKSNFGIEPRYRSCHTTIADGYAFEGHIPAHIIQQFLIEKPKDVVGLSVPGMPAGSPGMEMGDRHDDYDVLLLKKDGSSEVYAHISETHKADH